MGSDITGYPQDICDRTFRFAIRIVNLCRKLDETTGVSRLLARQLLKSGTSIGANVEEAQAGQSNPDFISKISISLKEARETVYWLRLLEESKLVTGLSMKEIKKKAEEIAAILGAIIVSSRKTP